MMGKARGKVSKIVRCKIELWCVGKIFVDIFMLTRVHHYIKYI